MKGVVMSKQDNIAVAQSIQEGTSGSSGMLLAWNYYDRTLLKTGATHYDYFATQQGQMNKTLADTNFQLGGQMPSTQKMWVTHIGLEVQVNAVLTAAQLVQLNTLLTNSIFYMVIQNKAPMFQLAGSTILNSCFNVVAEEADHGVYVHDTIKTGYYKIADKKSDSIILAGNTAFTVGVDYIGSVPAELNDKVFFKFNLKGKLLRTT